MIAKKVWSPCQSSVHSRVVSSAVFFSHTYATVSLQMLFPGNQQFGFFTFF